MSSTITVRSTVYAAIRLIAYDNGAVNRERPENEVVDKTIKAVTEKFSFEQLTEVEQDLRSLTEEDFYEVCCGEAGVVKVKGITDTVLDFIFETV